MQTNPPPELSPVPPQAGFGVRLTDTSMAQARDELAEALAAEGFNIVSEIDVRAILRQKLGVDIAPYVILGVCNPAMARRALEIEPYAGLALPCTVTLWDESGTVVVTAANPKAMMSILGDERLRPLALDAEMRLRGAIERLV